MNYGYDELHGCIPLNNSNLSRLDLLNGSIVSITLQIGRANVKFRASFIAGWAAVPYTNALKICQ
jgi:hypothetical protein